MSYTNFVNGQSPYISAQNLNNMQIELMKLVFPIGSTYITQTNTNPSTILKFGTWERLKGKVCLGLDEDDTDLSTIGNKGGEKKHTMTVAEMASHNHTVVSRSVAGSGTANVSSGTGLSVPNPTGNIEIGGAGNSQPFNIMQPYEVVGYMWKRTA